MKRALLRFVAIAVLAAAAAAATAEESPQRPAVRTSPEDYRIPERFGDFALEKLQEYEHAEDGFQAHYRGDTPEGERRWIDFFLYSAKNIPADVSIGDALWWEWEHTKHGIQNGEAGKAWGLALESEGIARAETPNGAVAGVGGRYQGALADGRRVISYAFVTALGTDFVKMRASLIASRGESRDSAIEAAPAAFLSALEWRGKHENLRTFHIEHSSNQLQMAPGESIPCWFRFETGYAAALATRITEGDLLSTLEREHALRAAALASTAKDGALDCDEPAIRDLAAIHRAGFGRELIWAAEHPSFWEAPADLRMAEFEAFRTGELAGRTQIERIRASVHFSDTDPEPAADTPSGAEGTPPPP